MAKEYIEREALIKAIASRKMVSVVPNCYEPKIKKAVCSLGQEVKAIIKNHQAADVVEVVRCKDCVFYVSEVCRHDLALNLCRGDDFCSYGERRTDND